MRRIRTPAAGEIVILEPSSRRQPERGFITIRLDVPKQFAVDFDVRKLVDRVRNSLADALRGRAQPALAADYSLGPISGTAAHASATILNTSQTAAEYFDRVFDRIAPRVLERETEAWLLEAMPPGGDGVATEARANTSGGPVPRR